MKKYSVFFLAILFLSCSKDDAPVTPGLPSDPAQYGTAFSKVPDVRDATVYQVNTRAFSAAGNLAGVTARLDSIKALGVNVVYLMPIYPVGTVNSINSPYCVKDFKAVATEFGTLEDLRSLVTKAHEKEMAVILDIVPNHTAWDHPWITTHKTWYQQNTDGNIIAPPGFNDVAQLNFSNDSLQNAMIEILRYWIFTANIDGYRFDFADNVPFTFWKKALTSLNSIPGRKLFNIAEGTRPDHFRAGFELKYGFAWFSNLKEVFGQARSATSITGMNTTEYASSYDGSMVLRYITNHDVNSSDGTPQQLFGGNDGALAAFIVSAYMKGVPMIYNGEEKGLPYQLKFPFTVEKINWTLNPAVTANYKKILGFRNTSAAIRQGELFTYSSDDIVAFTKKKDNETVFVMVNLRNRAVEYTLPASLAGSSWTDGFSNGNVTLATQVSLPAFSYRVLRK
ncbi:MAG: alpha-amylase family glycosyl hydrolase [Chitinophagaceae bacterium]